MQHLDEDLHLARGQGQEVLVPVQVDLLGLRCAHLASLDGTVVGQAEQLDDVPQLGHIGLEDAVADVTIDALQLQAVDFDDDANLQGHAEGLTMMRISTRSPGRSVTHLSLGEILSGGHTSVGHQVALLIDGGICVGAHLDHGLVLATVADRVEARSESVLQDLMGRWVLSGHSLETQSPLF